jgi:transposase InsO family protein
MVIPDALSRDTMDKDLTLCARCLETVGSLEEELTQVDVLRCADLSVQRVTEEQGKEFGDVKDMVGEQVSDGRRRPVNRVFTEAYIRIVVPKTLRSAVLKLVHESRMVGHWGFLRTAARLRKRFWWAGWFAAVDKQVAVCLACRLSKMKRSRRQAKMQVWHPKARFETISVDVLEISPTSATRMKKVVVTGDVISRFMMAIAVPAETVAAIAEVLFERWIAVFGPPVRLLSDRGRVFVSKVVQNLCARVGTKKIVTSPYAPQIDGMTERFNATLCRWTWLSS